MTTVAERTNRLHLQLEPLDPSEGGPHLETWLDAQRQAALLLDDVRDAWLCLKARSADGPWMLDRTAEASHTELLLALFELATQAVRTVEIFGCERFGEPQRFEAITRVVGVDVGAVLRQLDDICAEASIREPDVEHQRSTARFVYAAREFSRCSLQHIRSVPDVQPASGEILWFSALNRAMRTFRAGMFFGDPNAGRILEILAAMVEDMSRRSIPKGNQADGTIPMIPTPVPGDDSNIDAADAAAQAIGSGEQVMLAGSGPVISVTVSRGQILTGEPKADESIPLKKAPLPGRVLQGNGSPEHALKAHAQALDELADFQESASQSSAVLVGIALLRFALYHGSSEFAKSPRNGSVVRCVQALEQCWREVEGDAGITATEDRVGYTRKLVLRAIVALGHAPVRYGKAKKQRIARMKSADELEQMRLAKPAKWREKIKFALNRHKAVSGPAAASLGLSLKLLKSWIAGDPELDAWVQQQLMKWAKVACEAR